MKEWQGDRAAWHSCKGALEQNTGWGRGGKITLWFALILNFVCLLDSTVGCASGCEQNDGESIAVPWFHHIPRHFSHLLSAPQVAHTTWPALNPSKPQFTSEKKKDLPWHVRMTIQQFKHETFVNISFDTRRTRTKATIKYKTEHSKAPAVQAVGFALFLFSLSFQMVPLLIVYKAW